MIEDKRNETILRVIEYHLFGERQREAWREEENEKREVALKKYIVSLKVQFCCRVAYKRIVNMAH